MADERDKPDLIVDVETVHQRFEELVDRASEGKEVVIVRDHEPFAKLVPFR